MKIFIYLFFLLVLNQCVTSSPKEESQSKYRSQLQHQVREKQSYDGWQNKYNIRLALLNSKTQHLKNQFIGHQLQWSDTQKEEKWTALNKKLSRHTEVFMSFYVPHPRNDKLAQKKRSSWKVFLDVNRQRFEGKVTKVRKSVEEVKALYSFHSQWGTPYLIQFNAPTSLIDSYKSRLVITGPLGTAEFHFSPQEDK